MIPVQDPNHVTEALALHTSRYKNAPVTTGITTALALAIQDLENVAYSILFGVQLSNHPISSPPGPWDVLDKIGAIVGILRQGLSDTAYLAAIKIKIRIDRSHGLAEDIIQIARLVVAGAIYREFYPAAFEVEVDLTSFDIVSALLTYLGEARSAGTAGNLLYTVYGPWAAGQTLIFSDAVNPGLTPGTGLADAVSLVGPNELASLQRIH